MQGTYQQHQGLLQYPFSLYVMHVLRGGISRLPFGHKEDSTPAIRRPVAGPAGGGPGRGRRFTLRAESSAMPPVRRLRGSLACRLPSLWAGLLAQLGGLVGGISQLLAVGVAACPHAAAVVRVWSTCWQGVDSAAVHPLSMGCPHGPEGCPQLEVQFTGRFSAGCTHIPFSLDPLQRKSITKFSSRFRGNASAYGLSKLCGLVRAYNLDVATIDRSCADMLAFDPPRPFFNASLPW